jgi:hypothetical protein
MIRGRFRLPGWNRKSVAGEFPTVKVVALEHRPVFNLSAARNAAAAVAHSNGTAFIDCDIELSECLWKFVFDRRIGLDSRVTAWRFPALAPGWRVTENRRSPASE